MARARGPRKPAATRSKPAARPMPPQPLPVAKQWLQHQARQALQQYYNQQLAQTVAEVAKMRAALPPLEDRTAPAPAPKLASTFQRRAALASSFKRTGRNKKK